MTLSFLLHGALAAVLLVAPAAAVNDAWTWSPALAVPAAVLLLRRRGWRARDERLTAASGPLALPWRRRKAGVVFQVAGELRAALPGTAALRKTVTELGRLPAGARAS